MSTSANQKLVFWGCFVALVTTSFAFISRAFLVNDPNLWPAPLASGFAAASVQPA